MNIKIEWFWSQNGEGVSKFALAELPDEGLALLEELADPLGRPYWKCIRQLDVAGPGWIDDMLMRLFIQGREEVEATTARIKEVSGAS